MRTYKLNNSLVLVFSMIALVSLTFLFQFIVLSYTHGVFLLPIDEGYIRLATAKNVAFNQMWGLSKHYFVSASSSIGYPILLAAFFFIFGSHVIIPLIINLVAGGGVLYFVQKWLIKQGVVGVRQLLILLLLVLLIPLPILISMGMEHVLQILFSFLFGYGFCEWMGDVTPSNSKTLLGVPLNLLVLGMALISIRYEGIFLIVAAMVLLTMRRRWLSALVLGVVCSLPIVLFGLFSISKGGYFIPNTVLFKAFPVPLSMDNVTDLLKDGLINRIFYGYPTKGTVVVERLLVALSLLALAGSLTNSLKGVLRLLSVFWLMVVILHICFANSFFYYRYEAYLIGCCLPLIGVLIVQSSSLLRGLRGLRRVVIFAAICLLFFYPFFSRAVCSWQDMVVSSRHLYDQPYFAADFTGRFYFRAGLVVDDIGAVSYFADGRKLDLNNGFGNVDVAKSRAEDYGNLEYLDYLANSAFAPIAIVPERRYDRRLLQHWVKVACWHTENALPMQEKDLYFYAIAPKYAADLKKHLVEFERQLPRNIKVSYFD